ncbi:MAG: hypothetical protein Q9212_007537, partial [Teloschistes hypoglaucus]
NQSLRHHLPPSRHHPPPLRPRTPTRPLLLPLASRSHRSRLPPRGSRHPIRHHDLRPLSKQILRLHGRASTTKTPPQHQHQHQNQHRRRRSGAREPPRLPPARHDNRALRPRRLRLDGGVSSALGDTARGRGRVRNGDADGVCVRADVSCRCVRGCRRQCVGSYDCGEE